MSLNQTKHKVILVRILKEIYSHAVIGPHLGFKGGTAAYLFYNLDRFSVDLDFDLLDIEKEDLVFSELLAIISNFGWVKIADRKRYSFIYILDYEEKDVGGQNVKVEVNRRSFGCRYEIKTYLGISMKVMIPEDMAANKLVALYERIGKTNRDIYDSWFFLKNNWPVNKKLIEQRTNMTYKDFLGTSIDLVKKWDNKNILAGMGEVLDEKQKTWVKSKLKDELLFQLRLYLETSL